MTFPTIAQSDTFQKDDANATTFEVGAGLTGLVEDNTLLLFFATDGGVVHDLTADGFTQFGGINEGSVTMRVGWKKITASEPSTYTITSSGTQRAAAILYEIAGAADPAVDPPEEISDTGASAAPTPVSLTPSGGRDDYLWFAAAAIDRNRPVNGFPSNMTLGPELQEDGGGANSCSIGADVHQFLGTAFTPNAFSITQSEGWSVATVAVVPLVAADPPSGVSIPIAMYHHMRHRLGV